MFLTKIQTFLNNHKKVVLYTTIFCVISFVLSDVAFAAWETVAATDTVKKGINSILEGLNIALSVISVMLALLTYLSTLFLDPSWLNGSVFGLSVKFKEIWILVSNIVYFAFAFILIWIALVNIVWKAGDKFQLKQALPRFIAWILIVPFSWFIVQFILSISAILTVSALTLPVNTFPDYNTVMDKVTIPSKCTIDLSHDLDSKTAQNWFSCDENQNKKWEEGASRVSLNESFKKWDVNSSIFATISLYTYGVIQIDKLDEFSSSDIKAGVQSSIGFVVKLVIDLLFILIYAILMFALALVLITRWFYIWMYVMLSPIFWLMYFFEKWNWGDWFLWKFSIKEFIALAMVPVYTLLALSFGMLFIFVVWKWLDTSSDGNKWNLEGFSYENDTFSIWNFSLKVKWAVGWSSDKENTKESVYRFMKEWGDWALWAIGVLIMQLFGLAVLWIAVMAWMKSSKITAEVIAPLDAFGKQIWWLIAKAPHYAPIFPGGQSMQSMNTAASQVSSSFQTAQNKKWTDFVNKMPFMWNDEVDKKSRDIWNIAPATREAALDNIYELNKILDPKKLSESWEASKSYANNIDYLLKNNWFKPGNDEEIKKIITTIRAVKWDAATIDESLARLDELAIAPSRSILWGEDVVKKWQVWSYMWSWAKKRIDSNDDSDLRWGTIDTSIKSHNDINYYNVTIGWDSIAQVSWWKLIEIPGLSDINKQRNSLAEKISQVYTWDLSDVNKLKEFITKESNIDDSEDMKVILSKINDLSKDSTVKNEGDVK